MKSVVQSEYGSPDVLRLADRETPAPREREILVRVHAASVNFGDLLARRFAEVSPREFHMPTLFWLAARVYFGYPKPRGRVLGSEFSGVVAAAGAQVRRFREGEEVFGYRGQSMGAYAEYLRVSEDSIVVPKPAGMTHEEAAAAPYGGIMALNLLRKAHLAPGESVLIHGASGGIGSAAVQLARSHFGAQVTGVCGTPRIDFVKELGAHHVVDYTRQDFTRSGRTYDLIVDVLGKSSFGACRKALSRKGRYFRVSFKLRHLLQMAATSLAGGRKVICTLLPERREDLETIRDLVEAGKFRTIVDRSFPLAQAAEAHRYAESGERRAAVVLSVGPGGA